MCESVNFHIIRDKSCSVWGELLLNGWVGDCCCRANSIKPVGKFIVKHGWVHDDDERRDRPTERTRNGASSETCNYTMGDLCENSNGWLWLDKRTWLLVICYLFIAIERM